MDVPRANDPARPQQMMTAFGPGLLHVVALALLAVSLGAPIAHRGVATIDDAPSHLPAADTGSISRDVASSQTDASSWSLQPIARHGGATYAVAGNQGLAFVGVGARVIALDLGDPDAPTTIGESPVLGGVVQDLALEGDLLYVAWQAGTPKAERGGLAVLGVEDPAQMALLRQVPVDVAVRRLAMADGVALTIGVHQGESVRTRQHGALLSVDPRPAGPAAIGEQLAFEGSAVAIERIGDRAYVMEVDEEFGDATFLHALSIADPMAPERTSFLEVSGRAKGLASSPKRLYLAAGVNGLHLADATARPRPLDLGRASAVGGCADDVALATGILAVLDACSDRLSLFGLSPDGSPVARGALSVPPSAHRLGWLGGFVAIALGAEGGVLLVDAQDPDAPVARGAWPPVDGLGSVAAVALVEDRTLLVATHPRAGVTALRLEASSGDVRVEGHLAIDGVEDIALVGDRLIATDDAKTRLDVIDLDGAQPRVDGSLPLPEALDVVAHPDLELAYVAGYEAGLRVVDVSSPGTLALIGAHPSLRSIVLAMGGGGLVAVRRDELSTLDIGLPAMPLAAGSVGLRSFLGADVLAVAASADRAFVYSAGSTCVLTFACADLEVFDISELARPRALAHYPNIEEPAPLSVAFADGLVYLGGGTGLAVYDAAALDAANAPLAVYPAPGPVMDVAALLAAADGRTVLVAEGDGGLGVYRLVDTAPAQPSATSSGPLPTPRPAPTGVATSAPSAAHRIHLPLVANAPVAAPKRAALRIARTLAGPSDGLAVGDGVVYFGTGGSIAVIEPGSDGPREVGHSAELPGRLRDIVVDGDRLYAAVGELGLAVFSVADPRRPVLLGIAPTGGTARGVAVGGSLAYVAAGDGLEVFEVAGAPHRLSTTPVGHSTRRVWFYQGHAYVGAADGTPIQVFDVTEPRTPRRVSVLEGGATDGWALAFYDRYAYVQNCMSCIDVFDISEPSAPELVPVGPQSLPFLEIRADDIAIEGRTMLTTGSFDLDIFDLANPISPALKGSVPIRWPMGWERVAMRDGLAATATESGDDAWDLVRQSGVELFEVSTNEAPVSLGFVVSPLLGAAGLLPAADPNYVYVVGDRLEFLNSGRDAQPPAPSGRAERHQIGFSEDAWLLDVSEPDAPVAGPVVPAMAGTTAMAIDGTTGYAIRNWRSLAVLDLSVAAKPRLLSELDLGEYLLTVASAGPTTIVRAQEVTQTDTGLVYTNTLHVVDASDPARPVLAGTFELPSGTSQSLGLAASGTTAWVHGVGGIRSLDVSDPGQSHWVGELPIPGIQGSALTTNFVARGDRLWVGAVDGLVTVDIGDPANPRIVGRALGGAVYALWPWGEGLLLARGCGATAYDVSGPGAATLVATLESPPYAPLPCGLDVASGVAANGRFYAQLGNQGAGGAVVLEVVTE